MHITLFNRSNTHHWTLCLWRNEQPEGIRTTKQPFESNSSRHLLRIVQSSKLVPRNEILKLENDTFVFLQECKNIDLSNNKIHNLESKCFKSLNKVTFLNLQDNRLTVLRNKTFVYLSACRKLNLNKNEIHYVKKDSFLGLDNLEVLQPQSNQLMYLKDFTFVHLRRCISIQLQENKIFLIETNAFYGLAKLKTLHLEYNDINIIDTANFISLKECIVLNLEKSNIDNIKSYAFEGLNKLKTLNLRSNDLQHIETNAFSGLNNLEILYLEHNHLKTIWTNMSLDQHNCQNVYLKLKNIFIPESLENTRLEKTKILRFQGNYSMEKFKECLTLHNKMKTSHPFQALKNLRKLYLFKNQLEDVDQHTFLGLTYLQKLELQKNFLTIIRNDTFIHLSKCEYLFIHRNKIQTLESLAFRGLYSLKTLDLSQNQIVVLENNVFDGMLNLHTLQLSENNITSFSWKACSRKNSSMNMASWRAQCFQTNIYLNHNPLNCSEKLCWMKDLEWQSLFYDYPFLETCQETVNNCPSIGKKKMLFKSLDTDDVAWRNNRNFTALFLLGKLHFCAYIFFRPLYEWKSDKMQQHLQNRIWEISCCQQ